MEGPRPTQSQTLGSGGVGLLLGAAQLLEAAIRWNRKINASAIGIRRVVMDNSLLSRFEACQIGLGVTPQIPTLREVVKEADEEFGPHYLLSGLGAGPESARGLLSWNPLSNARKDREEKKASPKLLSFTRLPNRRRWSAHFCSSPRITTAPRSC